MTKDEAFNSFHQWLTFRNYAKGTVTDYLYNFKIFSESIPPDFDYSELTHQHAIDFVFKLRSESQWSPASINLLCSSLRCFYDVILDSPISIRRLPNVKYTLDDPKIFTDSEIALLIKSADVRLRAMIYLGYDCGLRTSEVARLRIKDIDSDQMLLHVVHSKRGKSRYVKLSQQCLQVLRDYWKVYRPSDWMFPGKVNGHIMEFYPSSLFHKLLKKLNIRPEDSLTFHCLRHTYGTTMRNDDCDIFTLKKLLGHSCLKSTNRYIRISTSDIPEIRLSIRSSYPYLMSGHHPNIQDIFCYAKDHDLIDYSHLSFKQIKAVENICICRTSSKGLNAETCDQCGYKRIHYNSCRDPNCPMCQAFKREVWVAKQECYTLNIKYYHVVFTIPDDLNPYILLDPKAGYSVLFEAAAETLNTLAVDKKYLGAKIGFTAVLHTWSSTLDFHPHLHVILSGGGYTEDKNWISKDNFIFPVFVLSSLFRGKFLGKFKKHFDYNRLEDISTFNEVIDSCYRKDWLVYTKRPFDNPDSVIRYLGRYTHRIAISNARIKAFDNGNVTFSYKDYRDQGRIKNMNLSAKEFVRRFLMHVVPKNFTKIRHYGFLANAGKRDRIKMLCDITETAIKDMCEIDKIHILTKLIGHDPRLCPVCKSPLKIPFSFPLLE